MLDFSKAYENAQAGSGNNKKKKVGNFRTIDQVNAEYGLVQPQAIDLEEAVLGALMLEKGAELEVLDLLKAESFYKEAHQHIFQCIVDLSSRHDPIDMLTVTEELRKKNMLEEVGGAYYVAQLTERVASAAHIEFHARIIAQKYLQRELIRITSDIQSRAYDPGEDINDLLDSSEQQLFNLSYGNIKKESSSIADLVRDSIERIEEASQRGDGLSGVPSGFTSLDRVTSGWQPSDLIILAARPAMGKTAFVLSMMRNMAMEHNVAVAMFSLEMSGVQLVSRLIVAETELPGNKVKNGKLESYEWEQLELKVGPLAEAPIFIDDTPAISIFEFRAKARRLKMQHDVKIIIIDYLQLMTGTPDTRGNREQEVSTISRGLKAVAKELNVPIIALSQLNRSVEMRSGDKRPQLSDLRESGAIEQDADIVTFIHRPEKFGIDEDQEGNSTKGKAELIIAKHRNGAVTDVQLRFREELAKFEDLEGGNFGSISDFSVPQSVTVGSKMNEETPSNTVDRDDFVFKNNDFTNETPF